MIANEELRYLFVKFRQAIRDGLTRGAGIPTNPGSTDEELMNGIKAWLYMTKGLREENQALHQMTLELIKRIAEVEQRNAKL